MSKPKSQFIQIINLAKPFWSRGIVISVLLIIASLLRQLPAQIQRYLVDLISTGQPSIVLGQVANFSFLIFSFLIIITVQSLIDRLAEFLTYKTESRLRYHLRGLAYDQLLKLSVPYYNKKQSGALMSQIQRGSAELSSAIKNITNSILPSVVTAIFTVFIVASINWQITVAVILGFAVYFPLRLRRFRTLDIISKKMDKLFDQHYGHFHEAISNIRLVKSFTAEAHESTLYRRFTKRLLRHVDQYQDVNNKYTYITILLNAWFWLIFAYIFYQGVTGALTLGVVVLLIQYLQLIRQPFTSIEWTFWEIKRAQTGARDYLKIINATDYTYKPDTPISPESIKGLIEFKDVSFTYPEKGGSSVFKNFSLEIKPGQTLAVVGKSGAGKTTLAHLLIRFFDPDKGKINIDGFDIREMDLNFLRQHIGLVMQTSYLFADTIEENLRYAKPDATLEEMIVACKVAHAHDFIKDLPKGYKTKIGERGIKLSGGQQQRLNIARTILKNPPILILDEATSSLDSHSERLVQDALEKLIKGRTTIIIAHRLSTIRKADQIIVLGKKKVLEQGTHEELIKKKQGVYASLHAIQSGNFQKLKDYELS